MDIPLMAIFLTVSIVEQGSIKEVASTLERTLTTTLQHLKLQA